MEKSKSIVLFSNVFKEDSLSSFKNLVPQDFLNPNHHHEVALAGLGFHYQLKNNATPKESLYPVLIQIFRKDFKAATGHEEPEDVSKSLQLESLVKNNEDFHIDECQSYTPKSLANFLNELAIGKHQHSKTVPRGFPAKFEDGSIHFSQFNFPFERFATLAEKRMYECILLFHERFADSLNLCQSEPLSHLFIGSEKYYFFQASASGKKTLSSKNEIIVKRPKILHVCSSNVKSTMVDQEVRPLLRRIALPSDGSGYLTFNFKNLHYIPTLQDFNTTISIQLLDENKNQLRLSSGFATYVILKVTSSISE